MQSDASGLGGTSWACPLAKGVKAAGADHVGSAAKYQQGCNIAGGNFSGIAVLRVRITIA